MMECNNIVEAAEHEDKPCKLLGYCPYGVLVESFGLDDLEFNGHKVNCKIFGHHCPMFFVAEKLNGRTG